MTTADRIKQLRKRLDLTQQELADRAIADGDPLDRVEVNKLEIGTNKGGTARIVRALATASGVTMDAMYEYLSGRTTLDELLASAPPAPSARYADLPGWKEARARAQARWHILPPEAFDEAESCPMYRPVREVDDMLVLAVAAFSWFTLSADEQADRATRSAEHEPRSQRPGLTSAHLPKALPGT